MNAEIFNEIRAWAYSRRIPQESTPHHQIVKIGEEFGELCDAVLHNNKNDYVDAIGDIIIALTVLGTMLNVPIEKCLYIAWEEVKNRKGMTVDGAFIKEAKYADTE